MSTMKLNYKPHPKQKVLHQSPANEILYGGAAGPGKSYGIRWEAVIWALRIPGIEIYLFRRTFPDLERNHIIPSLKEFPKELGTYSKQEKRWYFNNGSILHFCHAQYEQDVYTAYQGAEMNILLIDEVTQFTEAMYRFLLSRVRIGWEVPKKYAHKIPLIVVAANPGGVGHEWVKRRWVTFAAPYEIKKSDDGSNYNRQYIPGVLEDNPTLTNNSPGYAAYLDSLPEPLRSAYRYGDWDIFMGQAFDFSREHHVIKPIEVPEGAPVYMTFDWGFGAPFSVGWWWVDEDNRLYRFDELYGWNGNADEGLRKSDSEIAEMITKKEEAIHSSGLANMRGRRIIRLCDPTCFNKKPDYKGGGQGPSTADVFRQHGLILTPGDPNRELKIRAFRERMRVPEDERPYMQVYDTCEDGFIRTIPLLQLDTRGKEHKEDVDTTMEDHVYDEASLIFMTRPLSLVKKPEPKTKAQMDWDNIRRAPKRRYRNKISMGGLML